MFVCFATRYKRTFKKKSGEGKYFFCISAIIFLRNDYSLFVVVAAETAVVVVRCCWFRFGSPFVVFAVSRPVKDFIVMKKFMNSIFF